MSSDSNDTSFHASWFWTFSTGSQMIRIYTALHYYFNHFFLFYFLFFIYHLLTLKIMSLVSDYAICRHGEWRLAHQAWPLVDLIPKFACIPIRESGRGSVRPISHKITISCLGPLVSAVIPNGFPHPRKNLS